MASATVVLRDTDFVVLTDENGRYEIKDIPPGQYQLRVLSGIWVSSDHPVRVSGGAMATGNFAVSLQPVAEGEVIVIAATRRPEKLLDAPVNIKTVAGDELANPAGSTFLSALAYVDGVDYADAGLLDHRFSTRGFSTHFNNRMLFIIDNRLASVAGTAVPQEDMIPVNNLDMKSMEVVLGPASALYGPNAHTGVIHVQSKTPWDESGASVQVRGGTHSLMDGSARVAGTIGSRIGWKLTGQYMSAEDFEPDRNTMAHFYGTSYFEGDLLDNYDIGVRKVEGNAYYLHDGLYVKAGAGLSSIDRFLLSNISRIHVRDSRTSNLNIEVSYPHVYAQFSHNTSTIEDSYFLSVLAGIAEDRNANGEPVSPADLDPIRDDIALYDNSEMMESDLQYYNTLFGVNATVGLQWRLYRPDSGQLADPDDPENDLRLTEFGGYAQLDREFWQNRLRAVGAARVDTHSNYSAQFSPMAAMTYAFADNQKIRFFYQRAFKSPSFFEQYLRFGNGVAQGNISGYTIRDMDDNVVAEIAPLAPEKVHSVEIGYKGILAEKFWIDAAAYHSWYNNFISALIAISDPNAEEMPTWAFVGDQIVNAGAPFEGRLLTYINFGNARVYGADLSVGVHAHKHIELAAGGSIMGVGEFTSDNPVLSPQPLNAPTVKLQGSATVSDWGLPGYFVKAAGRFHNAYEFASGYWQSSEFLDDGKVPSRFVADLSAGYTFRPLGVSMQLHVLNVFDNRTIDILGGAQPSRLVFLQLGYKYRGLNF
ncbi:MAG: TonB-dependent receptor [Proteobacteria bacterium]|nr:TonB-dependent receptor [Pseudomonadota bacterium]